MEEETAVAQHLQLLADFVADVTVAGMQGPQFAFKGVDVFIPKFDGRRRNVFGGGAKHSTRGRVRSPFLNRRLHRGAEHYTRSFRSGTSVCSPLNSTRDVEDVQGPAVFGDGEFREGFDFAEAVADSFDPSASSGLRAAFADNADAGTQTGPQ